MAAGDAWSRYQKIGDSTAVALPSDTALPPRRALFSVSGAGLAAQEAALAITGPGTSAKDLADGAFDEGSIWNLDAEEAVERIYGKDWMRVHGISISSDTFCPGLEEGWMICTLCHRKLAGFGTVLMHFESRNHRKMLAWRGEETAQATARRRTTSPPPQPVDPSAYAPPAHYSAAAAVPVVRALANAPTAEGPCEIEERTKRGVFPDWIELRDGVEFCKLCWVNAQESHLWSAKHQQRVQWHKTGSLDGFPATAYGPGAPPPPQVSSPWPPPSTCGPDLWASGPAPPIPPEWGDASLFEWKPERGAYWCRLCWKQVDDSHIRGNMHRSRAARPEDYLGGDGIETAKPGFGQPPPPPGHQQGNPWAYPPPPPPAARPEDLQARALTDADDAAADAALGARLARLPPGWRCEWSQDVGKLYYYQVDIETGRPLPTVTTWEPPPVAAQRPPPPPPTAAPPPAPPPPPQESDDVAKQAALRAALFGAEAAASAREAGGGEASGGAAARRMDDAPPSPSTDPDSTTAGRGSAPPTPPPAGADGSDASGAAGSDARAGAGAGAGPAGDSEDEATPRPSPAGSPRGSRAAPAAAPAKWRRHFSAEWQCDYFVDEETGLAQWEPPPAAELQLLRLRERRGADEAGPAPSAAGAAGGAGAGAAAAAGVRWRRAYSSEHQCHYFVNADTGKAQWETPPDDELQGLECLEEEEAPGQRGEAAAEAAGTTAAAPLASGAAKWRTVYSAEHDCHYYVCDATGEAQWEQPPEEQLGDS